MRYFLILLDTVSYCRILPNTFFLGFWFEWSTCNQRSNFLAKEGAESPISHFGIIIISVTFVHPKFLQRQLHVLEPVLSNSTCFLLISVIETQPIRRHMQRFRTLSPLPSLVRPKRAQCGAMGCPRNIFLDGILIFLLLRSPCQISKP